MDGITAVTARISEIRALLHPAAPPPSSPAAAAGAASAGPSFADALAKAGAPSAGPSFASPSVADAYARAGTPATAPSFVDALGRAATPAAAEPLSVQALKATYSNGKVPPDALASIGDGGHRLAAPAAAGFLDLRAAARRDGVTIGVTDSYRSYDAQVDVARRKGLYSQGGLAAEPGTSQHGWGLAVDLDLDARAQAWMRTNAGRFGFVEDTPREPWHWAFKR